MAGIKEGTAKKIHRSARAKAKKLGLGKERSDAYTYGAKRRAGWKPSREVKKSKRK